MKIFVVLKRNPELFLLLIVLFFVKCNGKSYAETKLITRNKTETIFYCDYHYEVSDIIGMSVDKWYENKVYAAYNNHYSEMFSKGYLVTLDNSGWTVEQFNGSILKVYKGK